MTTTLIRVLFTLTLLLPLAASAAGLPPWKFGMTKAEVASFKEFGPYKEFSNGDLETFNGRFHSRKENIQFFFDGGRLRRIGVYLGEGTDSKKAVATFQRAYEVLQQDSAGDIFGLHLDVRPENPPTAEFAALARYTRPSRGLTLFHGSYHPAPRLASVTYLL